MKQVKTIKTKVISHGVNTFEQTLKIYRKALNFILDVIEKEWALLEGLTTKEAVVQTERLIHRTKFNPSPKYDFTSNFYKFPSYFRRSAIAKAFGIYNSYQSNYNNWLDEKLATIKDGKKYNKRPPVLSIDHKASPVFYRGNMFKSLSNDAMQIKVYKNNDWVWETIKVSDKNFKNRNIVDWKKQNPTLIKVGKKYFINFSYEKYIKLNKTKIKDQIIIAVDLGITKSAVCSAMRSDGTVIGRKFINQPIEKDRMNNKLNKLKKAQFLSGKITADNYWRRINGLKKHIVVNTASEIIKFAEKHDADTIIFEYLGKLKVPKGLFGTKKLAYKLHHWSKIGVQSKVEEMAHYRGMRIRRVNPQNTSALAFDGSGRLKRNNKKDVAVFQTGKVYHADLNASYNIGARYFIREILKSFSEKKRLAIQAKVPGLLARTQLTLASLISLRQAMSTNGTR